MVRGIILVALALWLLLLTIGEAEAKLPGYIITGGELGEYAAYAGGAVAAGNERSAVWLPGPNAVDRAKPDELPSLRYDIYNSGSVHYALANGGPEFAYYPEARLLQHSSANSWSKLSLETAAFLDSAVADALASMARGELEVGPLAADLRARGLAEASYWFVPYPEGGMTNAELGRFDSRLMRDSGLAQVSGRHSEELIMRYLVATVSGQAKTALSAPPRYAVFSRAAAAGGAAGGHFGYYDPPLADRPGRFWLGSSPAGPYYETTPGFDALVASALNGTLPDLAAAQPAKQSPAADGESISVAAAAGVGLAVALVAVSGGLAAVRYAGRRR